MRIQTIDIGGEKFVIMPESEYTALLAARDARASEAAKKSENGGRRFKKIVPIRVTGTPVSEMIIRDRR